MPGLVLHDIRQYLLDQGVPGDVAKHSESRQREPFDQHLHPQVGHVPAGVGKRVGQQGSQVRVDIKFAYQQSRYMATLRARGATVGDVQTGPHERTAQLTDPSGNVLVLYEPAPRPS